MLRYIRICASFLEYGIGLVVIAVCKYIPYTLLRHLGFFLGNCLFYCVADFRKTALTNLALAFPHLTIPQRYDLAKRSMQHMALTFLELLAVESLTQHIDDLVSIATSEICPEGFLPEEVLSNQELQDIFSQLDKNQGIILFCGHQANWELPFLFITKRYPGLALAKSIKNAKLNRKIVALREIFKGKIASPQQGIHQALKALKKGHIVGIVGDQALLISSYSYPLFGEPAFTTTSPALLAYKTGKPVIGITVHRHSRGYTVIPSRRLYPDKSLPMRESCHQLMDQLMGFLEQGILAKPEQWMWMHKRWKRKLTFKFKKKYAYSHLLVVVPSASLKKLQGILDEFSKLYAGATLTLACQGSPESLPSSYIPFFFSSYKDLLALPNTFPAVIDLIGLPRSILKHFYKTGSKAIYCASEQHSQKSLIKKLYSFLKRGC